MQTIKGEVILVKPLCEFRETIALEHMRAEERAKFRKLKEGELQMRGYA